MVRITMTNTLSSHSVSINYCNIITYLCVMNNKVKVVTSPVQTADSDKLQIASSFWYCFISHIITVHDVDS